MPETIQIACPHCSAKLNVTEQHLGKRVKCPKCQQPFAPTIPAAVVNEAADSTSTDEATIKWTCPGCFQEFMVRHEGEYDLCPDCESSKATSRQSAPAQYYCPGCDQYFDSPFNGDYCPACVESMLKEKAKSAPVTIPLVLDERKPHLPRYQPDPTRRDNRERVRRDAGGIGVIAFFGGLISAGMLFLSTSEAIQPDRGGIIVILVVSLLFGVMVGWSINITANVLRVLADIHEMLDGRN